MTALPAIQPQKVNAFPACGRVRLSTPKSPLLLSLAPSGMVSNTVIMNHNELRNGHWDVIHANIPGDVSVG